MWRHNETYAGVIFVGTWRQNLTPLLLERDIITWLPYCYSLMSYYLLMYESSFLLVHLGHSYTFKLWEIFIYLNQLLLGAFSFIFEKYSNRKCFFWMGFSEKELKMYETTHDVFFKCNVTRDLFLHFYGYVYVCTDYFFRVKTRS